MAGWRQAVALAMTGEEIEALTALSRSRTEPAGRVSRAAMLLGYREKPSFFAVGRRLGVHHQTVQRCVERAMACGALAALDDRPRPGKEPTITPEAKAWLVSLACDKAKEHGYPHELWTTRLLARHARERGPAAGHQCLARLAQGTVCKLLGQEEIKPHKVRYYLERRDAEFEPKMAEVLCVYREVQVLKKAAAKAEKSKKPVAIVSYDEKPGIQAIATTAPDLPPVPGRHASFARDHEYKRHGTLSLLAGIDLLTGKVHALVRERHRSREFIEFLKLLDAAYPASTAIKLILDNHSAHISRETRAWLDTRPPGRFDFTFTPKHGSWLNLIEGFFSKFARSVLRHIRVTSKHELKQRIMAGIDDVNRHPVIHTWSYKLAEAADMISNHGNADLVLSRGGFCPKDRRQAEGLLELHREMEVGYCRLVMISTDNITETNEYRSGVGAHWPFLSDTRRIVQKDLDIAEYTDPTHNPMIPHVIVLEPGLVIYKIYNGYWFFGRPTLEELRQDLRAVTKKCRPDWDITTPELKAAWQQGRKELFYPYGKTYAQTIGEQD